MSDLQKKLQAHTQHIRLTTAERSRMRADLLNYIEERAPTRTAHTHIRFFHMLALHPMRVAFGFLFICLFGTGSTAFAAQGALPGDVLYPIKVRVTEAVQVALATTPEEQASVHAELATVRLAEAQTLAAQGRLTGEVVEQLTQNFSEHTSRVQALAQAASSEQPEEATPVQLALASSLSVADALLEEVGKESKDDDTRRSSAALAQTVRTHVLALAPEEKNVSRTLEITTTSLAPTAKSIPSEQPISTATLAMPAPDAQDPTTLKDVPPASATPTAPIATTSEKTQKLNQRLKEKTNSTLQQAVKAFESKKAGLSTTTALKVGEQVDEITAEMKEGDERLSAGNIEEATQRYSQALKDAVRLKELLKASDRLPQEIVSPLLHEKRPK